MEGGGAVVTAGTLFAISGPNGDIEGHTANGLFAHDTRFLSAFRIRLQGKPLVAVGCGQLNHSAASFYCTNAPRRGLPAGAVSVARDRYVAEGLHEDITLVNHSPVARRLHLELTFEADFADLFEVRRGTARRRGRITCISQTGSRISFQYRRGDFERRTVISIDGPHPEIRGNTVSFDLELAPKALWKTCVSVLPILRDEPEPMACVERVVGPPFGAYERTARPSPETLQTREEMALRRIPLLETEDSDLASAYEAAVADLRSLRMEYLPGAPILAAGLPWFMAVFGRDSIISAIQTKLLGPELMAGTLATLAALQATDHDPFRESAPGKIPHEIRMGELSLTEEVPHSRYYGSVDATLLFPRLLWEAFQWTGDRELLERFLPAAEAAAAWAEGDGDPDGDGFVEYGQGSKHGLRNQGWKDSQDSIAFPDGTTADGPIALVEVQGYAYDARRCLASLLEVVGRSYDAVRLRRRAENLRRAFRDAFWMPEERFFALALDGRKRQVDAIASNPGHLLWSGILGQEDAAPVVERLMAPDMFSGWGVRTLSTEMARYNPLSYHNGSIWPHDNSLIAAGMARYGFRDEAHTIVTALIEAASHFRGHRLPELFAGYPRREHSFPLPYPAANVPQAWACGAVILGLEILLGVRVEDGKLVADPLPQVRGNVRLHRTPFRGMEVELG